MAISVSVPKEITEYRSKIFFGLSGRQLAYLLLSVLLGVGLGALCYLVLNLSMEITGYIIIAAVLPFVALGFIRPHNMPLEAYLALLYRHSFGNNQLPYESELLLDVIGVQKRSDPNSPQERGVFAHEASHKRHSGAGRARLRIHETIQTFPRQPQGGKGNRRYRQRKVQIAKQEIKRAGREVRRLRKESTQGKAPARS